MENAQYLNPNFNIKNIDIYYARKSILNSLEANKNELNGTLLDVGCGLMPYKSILVEPFGKVLNYIGLDFDKPITSGYSKVFPDLTWDGHTIPLVDESVDSILLTEVLEHCFEPSIIIKECFRVLKSSGKIFITVPFLWPLHDIPFDEYRYTPYSLKKILNKNGFEIISLEGLGGWDASLGQMMSLWIKRSGINGWRRFIIYHLLFRFFIKWLYKRDKPPKVFTDNAYMITGISILAFKN